MTEKYQLPKILLVEDNPMDVELTKECFEEANIIVDLYFAENGVEAFEFLKGNSNPDIILLDLNMPKMDGREFLKKLKSDAKFKSIPVVILTTSEAHKDILSSYKLCASAYLSKPVRHEKFVEMMKKFNQFFLTFVKFPPKNLQ